jgi:hypothetical protein
MQRILRAFSIVFIVVAFCAVSCDSPQEPEYDPWEEFYLPGSPGSVSDIFFNDPSDGWACTSGGYIHKYDGNTWELSASLDFHGDCNGVSSEIELYDVDFSSRDDGWAVGITSDYPRFPVIFNYDGEDWTDVTPEIAEDYGVYSVSAVSPNDVWFGGEHGYVIHYDGTSFTPSFLPKQNDVLAMHFLNEDFGVALTAGFLFFYDGEQWNYDRDKYPICDVYVGDTHGDLYFGDVDDGWVVSASWFGPELPVRAYAYHFNGRTWEDIGFFTKLRRYLYDVHGNGGDNVWVVSSKRTWKYDGVEWLNVPIPEGTYPYCIWVTETNDVWVGCNNGTIIKYKG